jgi:hypothetical protein
MLRIVERNVQHGTLVDERVYGCEVVCTWDGVGLYALCDDLGGREEIRSSGNGNGIEE